MANKGGSVAQDTATAPMFEGQNPGFVSHAPADVSRLLASLLPGAGVAGAMGYAPKFDSENSVIPSGMEKGPDVIDRLKDARTSDEKVGAVLSVLGVIPDAAYLGTALRPLGAVPKGSMAALSRPKPDDPLYSPTTNTVDWGAITPEMETATGGEIRALPLRVNRGLPGRGGYGFEHMSPDRIERIEKMGFKDGRDYLDYVAQNFDTIFRQPQEGGPAIAVSPGQGFKRNRPAHNLMSVRLGDAGTNYSLTTIMPDAMNSYLSSAGRTKIYPKK